MITNRSASPEVETAALASSKHAVRAAACRVRAGRWRSSSRAASGGGSPTTMSPGSADQGAGDSCRLEHVEGGLRGVALGDPADVELHPRLLELDGPRRRVEHHLVGADQRPGLGEPRGVRQLVVAAGPPPEPADRGDRDVERTA